jgi:glycosyltransferase involved in cell wall biosynthesis
MEKIISIIVPAYNMEDYLERCLTSILDYKWNENLEVIVVNDGSKDRTLQIALMYKEKFPEVIIVIDKKNGHYGSTINSAIPIAQGKYVKILDADDWFDTKEFGCFIEQLKTIDSDLVITNYTKKYISGKNKTTRYSPEQYNKIFDFSILLSSYNLINLHRHAGVTYRTELLNKINYKQSEGILYTDLEWIFYPMFYIKTIVFIDLNIYQHFIGRIDQSTDKFIILRNISHFLCIAEKMYSYYIVFDKNNDLECNRRRYLKLNIIDRYRHLYLLYLFHQPYKIFDPIAMKKFDEYIKEKDLTLYKELETIKLHRFIPFPYIWYWRRYSKRIPQWIIDILIKIKGE